MNFAKQPTADDLTPRQLMDLLKKIPLDAGWIRKEYEEILFRKLGYEPGDLETNPGDIPALYTLDEVKVLRGMAVDDDDLLEIHLAKVRLGGQRLVQEGRGEKCDE